MLINDSLTLYPAGELGLTTYNKYVWSTTSSIGNYVHFKTNSLIATYTMVRVEAVGINYATGAPIRCAWVWYTYSYLANAQGQNIYSGLTADGVYVSSDNYVVLRGTATNLGDSSLSLNIMCVNPSNAGANISITAVNQNSNSGNYY